MDKQTYLSSKNFALQLTFNYYYIIIIIINYKRFYYTLTTSNLAFLYQCILKLRSQHYNSLMLEYVKHHIYTCSLYDTLLCNQELIIYI